MISTQDRPLAQRARDIAACIEANGYAEIEDFVLDSRLNEAQSFVNGVLRENGFQYVALSGCERLGGTFLEGLGSDAQFRDLCRRICQASGFEPAGEPGFYQILRCLTGSKVRAHSMRFHYDSYVLTALIPIIVPTRGKKGDLLIFPNLRGVRSHYVRNLIDKVIVDNPIYQRFASRSVRDRSDAMVRINLRPGNLYFFWGYRSLHTNEPSDPSEVRCTALWHYLDPHAGSRVKRLLGRKTSQG